jgi:hypothetical protein
MSVSIKDRVTLPEEVLVSGLEEESVLLNLESEHYYGLDEVGTRMFSVLTTSNSIEAAFETLSKEYDVDQEVLRQDLISLVDQLVSKGLVEISQRQ